MILVGHIAGNVNFDHVFKLVSAEFLHYEVTILSFVNYKPLVRRSGDFRVGKP